MLAIDPAVKVIVLTGQNDQSNALRAVALGAGEIMLTSIDQEGTRKGFDVELLLAVSSRVKVPVIVSGGYGKPADLLDAVKAGASGIAIADALHWKRTAIADIKGQARLDGLEVRI